MTEYDAQDAQMETIMKSRNAYNKLQAELKAIEARLSNSMNGVFVYLADECVDAENTRDAGLVENGPGYWESMYASACMNGGFRAEEMGLDLNKEVGRVIY